MANRDPSDVANAFLRILRGLLRPLVKTMIVRGITAPTLYRLIKRIYVEVAEESFQLDDRPLTDSRIAMLTGVHRKDIRAFREEGDDEWQAARRKTALLATVIGQWLSNPAFLDSEGKPLVLPRSSEDGPSFDALVRFVSKDVRPRTVFDELERSGMIEEQGETLRLRAEAVIGSGPSPDKEVFFAANVGDHLAAATENLLADAPPFFERSVFYTRMTGDAIDEIEAEARQTGQSMLELLNQRSRALQQRDKDLEGNTQRYRLGIYFYREDTDPKSGAQEEGPE